MLFSPEDDTNKETSTMIGEMAVTAAKALLVDIRDGGKSMAEHLSSAGGRLCWDNTYNDDHAASLFKMAVNNPAERCFGSMIGQIQSYGKIVLTNDGGVSQVRVNGDLLRGFDTV